MESVACYYEHDAHNEWERLDRRRTEFAVTLRALAEFLPAPPATILDVGGGPGRYAVALAARGYAVTLVDLASANIQRAADAAARANVTLQGIFAGNALDLGRFPAAGFDAILLLGPLYHLIDQQDRSTAVTEASRLLKPTGVLFAAYLTRYSALRVCAERHPQWLYEHPEYVERLLGHGIHQGEWGFTTAYHAHADEIRPFMERHGFTSLELIGCEGIVAHTETSVNALGGAAWEWWVDLNYRLGKRPDLHAGATHLLYVGRKSP